MVKLTDDIFYYVHPKDANCNVYILKDGADLDFIDTGVKISPIFKWLKKAIFKDGLNPQNIRNIFHTHIHMDHVQNDVIFQSQAVRNKGNVKVFTPINDKHRFYTGYDIVSANMTTILKAKTQYPSHKIRGSMFFLNVFGKPLAKYQIPENINYYDSANKFQIGSRTGRIFNTGGHTEGHSFLFLNDETQILFNGDAGCINEYTSDWKKVLTSIVLADNLDPTARLGGHNGIENGKEKARSGVRGSYNRHDSMLRPILMQLRPNRTINLTDVAHRRVGFLIKLKLVFLWAHMTIYCMGKYLESLGLGTTTIKPSGNMEFKVTNSTDKFDLMENLRNFGDSPSRKVAEVMGIRKEVDKLITN
jgi:glyoxylase-like metal-dependent hydrolase (beta-lactamase superfamily II)